MAKKTIDDFREMIEETGKIPMWIIDSLTLMHLMKELEEEGYWYCISANNNYLIVHETEKRKEE